MRRADVALGNAQSLGSGVQVYEQASDTFSRYRLQLADDLRQAIRAKRIEVWYQPVVSAATGAVDRLEALARWDHPDEGLVPPAGRIETSMIAARAVTMGVDALQGYQLAAPMPAGGIPGLVRQLAISA